MATAHPLQLAFDFLFRADAGPSPSPSQSIASNAVSAATPAVTQPPVQTQASPAETPHGWRHPRANRELQLGAARVAYEFKRGQRRTIGLSVGVDGLVVSAPRWTPQAEVEQLLRAKADWVLDKLHQQRQRQTRSLLARIEWRDGAQLPYLGQPLTLRLDPGHRFRGAGAEWRAASGEAGAELWVSLSHQAGPAQWRDAVQAWLMRQAREHFTQRLDHYAPLLGVRYSRLRLSSAGTRWGSASADGGIRLNWRLLHFRPEVIDYVVAHELSHLREMNHSPRFWDTVASVMPSYAQVRGELRQAVLPHWD